MNWEEKYLALAELVDGYRRERDEAREQLDLTKRELGRWVDRETKAARERDEALARCETLRELADAAAHEQGLAQRRMMDAQRERDEARAEVERLRIALLEVQTSESAAAWFADGFHDGWKAGAEAMREACAQWIPHLLCTVDCDPAEQMRALPIPEDK